MKNTRWIPRDSRPIEHSLGAAYVHESHGPNGERYLAIAYAGKATTKSFYESFQTAAARDKRVADFFAGLESWDARKRAHSIERARPHSLQVGEILHHSWGWEQTNCDYYQVLAVTPHGATIQAIGDETIPESTYSHGMADMRVPVRDSFHGESFKIKIHGSNQVAKGNGKLSYGSIGVWNGKPNYCSWYA